MKRSPHVTWRLMVLMVGFALAGAIMTVRLVHLQLVQHGYYVGQATDEHASTQAIPAHRGAILDRNGYPLAISIDTYDVYINRKAWREWQKASTGAEALGKVVGLPAEQILRSATSPDDGLYLVRSRLDHEQGRKVIELALPGLVVRNTSRRFYPEGDLATTVLGFVGRDQQGLAGVEVEWQDELNGTPGLIQFERDTRGSPIPFGRRHVIAPKAGQDIVLTIDRYIQRVAEQQLDEAIRLHKATGGSIVIMEPKTGEILAMATRPAYRYSDFDPNDPEKLRLTRNSTITDYYEPGSVVKVLTTAAAIDLKLVNPNTSYVDTGAARVYDATITNWDHSVNGSTTVTEYLQKSLNTGSVWLSSLIGPERFYDYIRRFGLGEPTGVGFSAESSGLVRTPKDPSWSQVDLATNSYGQGIGASPVQILAALNSVVNGGTLMRPHIVKEISGPNRQYVSQPEPIRRVVSDETSKTMRSLLNEVVDGVPKHAAQTPGYRTGGKTGTTLVSIPGGYDLDSTLASFVGYAPAQDPVIGVLIKIDQPKDDPLGGRVATPVFPKIAMPVLNYLDVRPDALPRVQR